MCGRPDHYDEARRDRDDGESGRRRQPIRAVGRGVGGAQGGRGGVEEELWSSRAEAGDGRPDHAIRGDCPPVDDADKLVRHLTRAAAELFRCLRGHQNWLCVRRHQATVYFLTSKSEEDAEMRKMAPLMYCWGLLMVVVQIMAAIAMLLNTIFASCGTNEHCSSFVSYCQVRPGNKAGRCLTCGQVAPLVPYSSDEPYGADFEFKRYNEIGTGSYRVSAAFRKGCQLGRRLRFSLAGTRERLSILFIEFVRLVSFLVSLGSMWCASASVQGIGLTGLIP